MYINLCILIYIYICIYTYIYTYIHTYIHIDIYIYIDRYVHLHACWSNQPGADGIQISILVDFSLGGGFKHVFMLP